ncbi:cubilin homolog [Stegodyphus dumicola]|uniref:cubilin homolog n=1 Tax=Stegodyphus dumicola TaxID=202533 RepID=UPI0015AA847F|nr:cubilin homolog [Stegodyphus dumicola]
MKVCGVLVICSILCVLKFGNAENSFIFTSPEVIYARNTAYFTLLVSGIPSGGKVTVNLLRKNDSVVLSQSNVDVIPNRRVLVAMFVPHITDVNVATLHIFGNFSDGYQIDDKRDVSIQIDYFTVIQTANRERTTANPAHSLQYTMESFPTGSYNTTPIPEVCEYDVSSTRGVVSSPNYPDFYPKSMDCRWKFETAPGHRIKLAFNFFELEPGIKCQYDNVTLYDGNSTDTPLLAKFCGSSLPHIVTSKTHILLMTFHSDLSIEKHGFQALHSSE